MYALASRLHKTIYELEAMTMQEFYGWIAYFKLETDNANTANNNARN